MKGMKFGIGIAALLALFICVSAALAAQNRVGDSGKLTWAPTSAAVTNGDAVNIGHRYGVANGTTGTGTNGVFFTQGIWSFRCRTNDTVAVGDYVYWVAASYNVSTSHVADTFLGLSTSTKAGDTAGNIDVDINVFPRPLSTNYVVR